MIIFLDVMSHITHGVVSFRLVQRRTAAVDADAAAGGDVRINTDRLGSPRARTHTPFSETE